MNQTQRIIRNSASLIGSQILAKIVSLVSVPIIARFLGVNDFGIYTLAFGFVTIFSGLSDLGINTLTIKEVSRHRELLNKYLSNNLILRLLICATFYLILLLVLKIFNYPPNIFALIAILGIIVFANYVINTFNSILNAIERMEISALVIFLQYLIVPVTAITMLWLNHDLKNIFLAIIISNITLAIFYAIIVNKKIIKMAWQIDIRFWWYIIKKSIPFAIFSMLWLIYIQNGPIVLSKIQSIESVGIYNAANKLILALLFIPSSITLSIFPFFSRLIKNSDTEKINLSSERAIKILTLIAFPIAVGTTLLAKPLILTIYGQDFINSSLVLAILGWAMFFIFFDNPLTLVAINSSWFKKYLIYLTGITIFNIFLNILLGIKFNYTGVAISLLVSGFIKVVILLWFFRKELGATPNLINIFKKPVSIIILFSSLVYILSRLDLHIILIVIISIILYFSLLLLFREREFLYLIKNIFNKLNISKY